MNRNRWIGLAIFLAAAGAILGLAKCTGASLSGPREPGPVIELHGTEPQ